MAQDTTEQAVALDERGVDRLSADPERLILVDFWAEWCPPCRILGPTIDEIAGEAPDGVTVGKVDVDGNAALASRFAVRSIPTVVLLRGGEELERFVGVQPKQTYLDAIARHSG